MKGKFLLALLLGAGVAVAQGQEQQPGMPNSAPTTSPTGTTNDPSAPKAKQQAPVDQTESHTASSGTVAPTAPSTSVKGCLKQTGGGWTLTSDNGSTLNVTGDDSTLKPHDAQQVEVVGTQANDGSIQATSVNMIANTCPNQSGSTANASPAAPAGTEQPAGTNTAQDTTQSTTTQSTTTQETQTQQGTSTTPASAPVTDQTPATTVGTGSTAANGTAANMNGQNAAQTPATSPAATAPDQSAMQQTPSPTTTDQNPASASTGTSTANSNDNANSQNNNQNATANRGQDNNAGAAQKLPQTASPLPLLGLLGLGSLAGGFFARKKK